MADTIVKADWNGEMTGDGTLKGDHLDIKIAIPESLGGNGNGTEPKELLVSSAATCFIETLTSMLAHRDIPLINHSMNSEISSTDEGMKIMHYPKIALSADASEKQVQSAHQALEGTDRACPIGNLLKNAGVTVEYEGEVTTK